ncbi:pyrimidine-nucleoside phosphorylase [Candidatus Formimonas warabiya]|uniref:Pyrimidine-nucleoside phosphorylase n=1 Tax=Formimonas warabiya TaxID=1761012 RepID=A0A3G1L128_FORW1|nr:pyrimidine-nucleoside phosphorylase [Candidatus Formimonas warabiya]
MYDIILKKRNGGALTRQEIQFWVNGFVQDTIPDYQVAALLMAVFFQGLTPQETVYLTEAMIDSGEKLDLTHLPGTKADKHSTGGVGDKTTLVLAPLVASAGITMAKMSGRGLGHTGGTLDKLESIPGFHTDLSPEQFIGNVKNIGISVVGQTSNLVPADKKIYALRDVSATVDSVPLIAASVMSKKLAAGADVIVLDVKCGSGAFMKTPAQAEHLARMMVNIGRNMGKKVAAVISNMEQPLGYAVGNALEVKEAIHVLQGKGPKDIREICLYLAGEIFLLAGKVDNIHQGKTMAGELLDQGLALRKFREFVQAQGSNGGVVDDDKLLPEAKYRFSLVSEQDGFITKMETEAIGRAAMILGAGREKMGDLVDPGVGIVFYKKMGDWVNKGDTLAMIHANEEDKADKAKNILAQSIFLDKEQKQGDALIYGVITS